MSANISKTLKRKLLESRFAGVRQYDLARRAGIDATTLSKILHGAIGVELGDVRIIRLGRELGVAPEQCFATGSRKSAAA